MSENETPVAATAQHEPTAAEVSDSLAGNAPAPKPRTGLLPSPTDTLPDWAIPFVPAEMRTAKGVPFYAVRCRGERCTVNRGDRVLILTELSDGDEKFAVMRAAGDPNRVITELSKQQIRAIDGHVADFSGTPGPGSVDGAWTEIGPKHRMMLQRMYTRLNQMSLDEMSDFFDNCIAAKIA